MTVKEIIEKHLKENGFDGLAGDECGCLLEDLVSCGGPFDNCVPGIKIDCPTCDKTLNCHYCGEGFDWVVAPANKQEITK